MPQTLFLSFTPSSALSGRTTTYVPFFRAKALTPGPTDCSPSPPPPRGGLNGHLVDADQNMPGGYRPAAPRDATRRRRARSGGPHAPPPPRTVQQQRELVDDQSLMTNAAPRVNVSPLSSSRTSSGKNTAVATAAKYSPHRASSHSPTASTASIAA